VNLIEAYLLRPRAPFSAGADGFELLQLRRAKAPLLGTWQPIAGHIEPGETATQTAIREILEEAGFDCHCDPHFQGLYALQSVHPYYLAAKDTIVFTPRFVCVVQPNFEPTLNHENAAARWVSLADIAPTTWLWPGQLQAVSEIRELFTICTHRREHLRIAPLPNRLT
jgi:8-oxo-dGTP pyrophosphatase MutT (NUDIX family)